MTGFVNSLLGDGRNKQDISVNTPPPSAEEQELIRINTELSKRQLANIDQMAPFQQKLLELSGLNIDAELATAKALNAAVTPEQQAEAAKSDFERAQRLGPIQDELLQLQLDEARRGGAATPEQLQKIKEAADAGIAAGSADIDLSTKRGIGLISDELANSRGLRLSDSPIGSEAALLARGGEDQKASLIKNLRAGQASANLNFPLAAGQITSGINLSQQNLVQAASQFQAELRQRAMANRMALTGQTASSGIGIASVGAGAGSSALSSLSGVRAANKRTTGWSFNPSEYLTAQAKFADSMSNMAGGVGGAMGSDRRLKEDIERVGTLPSGIPIYSFRYIGTPTTHIGVMADEVLPIIPEAVSKDDRGYYMVDYSRLH